jgi:hypothetical protein
MLYGDNTEFLKIKNIYKFERHPPLEIVSVLKKKLITGSLANYMIITI